MSGNLCRQVREEIDQTELRQALSAGSEAHVAACAACATFRNERVRLREIVGGLQPVTAPDDFEMRLRARIARERDVPRQPFIFRLVMSTPAIVVAAVLVIVVGAIVFRTQMSRPQNSTVASDNSNQRADSNTASATVASEIKPELLPPGPAATDVLIKSKPQTVAVKNASKPNAPVTGGQQVDDFAIRSAAPVRIVDRAGEVSLTAPTKPLIVTMYDEHGGTRKIQLPPISFGSQRLTGNRTQVSMTNSKDW
jgi:hypothetical protein